MLSLAKAGHHYDPDGTVASLTTYMTVSIWPNAWDAADQGSKKFKFQTAV